MKDPKERAPSATEQLERELRAAETDITGDQADRHDSEAGDTLTPNRAAQREATSADEQYAAEGDRAGGDQDNDTGDEDNVGGDGGEDDGPARAGGRG